MPVIFIKTLEQYYSLINTDKTSVVLFAAEWVEQCIQIVDAMKNLCKNMPDQMQFISVEAENFPDLSKGLEIEAVPTIIFFNKGQTEDRIDGVDVGTLTAKCKKLSAEISGNTVESLQHRLKTLINRAPLMVFMKGDRNTPRCGFSKHLISILNETGLSFETYDILTDEEVRQGLKTYSDWPTYPQVYVNGELIGGLDIIKDLQANNELEAKLKS